MPAAHAWTEVEDATIRTMRESGKSWDVIARRCGVVRWTIIQRGKDLGLWRDPSLDASVPVPPTSRVIERDPLPAGHSLTWGVIVAGTCLEGEPYAAHSNSG